MRARRLLCTTAAVVLAWNSTLWGQTKPRLAEWERGVALQAPGPPGMAVYFWFYEWNMFDAVSPGQHTQGTFHSVRTLDSAGAEAVLGLPGLRLLVRVVSGGADLRLQATNTTGRDWPAIAGIIPCLSPGRVQAATPTPATESFFHVPRNPEFADPDRKRTYFLARDGLALLASRDIHFNGDLRAAVDRASARGPFVFSKKWPTSEVNAGAGLLVRESVDGRWVTGVGWEDFLSVQGHNPWNCMHACVRVGPLAPGQTKTIRGKLYLFQGGRNECLARFREDFPARR